MAALTPTYLSLRDPLGDRMVRTFRVTTGTAANATEWLATRFSEIIGVIGFSIKGTTGVEDPVTTPTPAVRASIVATWAGVAGAGATFTINGVVYTADTAPATSGAEPYFFDIEGSAADQAQTMADVINAGNGILGEAQVIPAVTSFGFGCMPHPDVYAEASGATVTITARVPGAGGNAITLAENQDNLTFAGAATTLAGGTDDMDAGSYFGVNFVLNAQGTSVTAGANNGDLGIECSEASKVIEVTVIGKA